MAALPAAAFPGTSPAEISPTYLAHQHERWINSVALSPDGKIVVSGSADRTTHAFFMPDGSNRAPADVVTPHDGTVYDVSLSGSALATATSAGVVRVSQVLGGEKDVFKSEAAGEKAWSAKLARNGRKLAWVMGQTITVTDVVVGKTVIRHRSKHGVASISITHDATTVFVLKKHSLEAEDYFVDVWTTTRNVISSTLFKISAAYWPCIASDADGSRLAIADDNLLRVLCPLAGRMVSLKGYSSPARVNAVAITPNGARVVSATGDGNFGVWDVNRQTKVAVLRVRLAGMAAGSSACAVSDDGGTVVGGCADNCVRVWRLWETTQATMEMRARRRFRAASRGQKVGCDIISLEEAKIELNAFLSTTEALDPVKGDVVEDAFFETSEANAETVSEEVFVRMLRRIFKLQQETYAKRMRAGEERRQRRLVERLVSEHAERFRERAKPGAVLSFRMAARVIGNLREEMWARYEAYPKDPNGKNESESVADQLRKFVGEGVEEVDEATFVEAVKKLVYEAAV